MLHIAAYCAVAELRPACASGAQSAATQSLQARNFPTSVYAELQCEVGMVISHSDTLNSAHVTAVNRQVAATFAGLVASCCMSLGRCVTNVHEISRSHFYRVLRQLYQIGSQRVLWWIRASVSLADVSFSDCSAGWNDRHCAVPASQHLELVDFTHPNAFTPAANIIAPSRLSSYALLVQHVAQLCCCSCAARSSLRNGGRCGDTQARAGGLPGTS